MPSNTQTFLKPSNIYFSLALVILVAAAIYGVSQFRVLQSENQAVTDNESRRVEIASVFEKEKKTFQLFADERAKKQADLVKKIASILPADENYTDLTRLFDDYFAENDRPDNPILQSSLNFDKGQPVPGMASISALPLTMNLDATRDNFFKFLDFINNAGSLETGTRLMRINSINLNFLEGGEVEKDLRQKINFTVNMDAFYQTPKVAR